MKDLSIDKLGILDSFGLVFLNLIRKRERVRTDTNTPRQCKLQTPKHGMYFMLYLKLPLSYSENHDSKRVKDFN